MKRNRLIAASMVVLALTAASCGDSGGSKTLSEDDFIDQMDGICRSATRAIGKIDFSESSAIGDVGDVMQEGLDSLNELTPPKALASDFDDFTANLDDQLTQIGRLEKAIKNDDQDAAQTASDKLTDLSAESDDLADSIGAEKCVGVAEGIEQPVTTDTVPVDTTVDTTEDTTEVTTPDTTEDTTTVNTPLPIDTSVDTTSPPTSPPTTAPTVDTSATGLLVPEDASAIFNPIPGYSWDTSFDWAGATVPTEDPVLRVSFSHYIVGSLVSDADPSVHLEFYVSILSIEIPWLDAQLEPYYEFEVGGGTDATTPTLGLPGRINGASEVSAGAFTDTGYGIAIYAAAGTDVAPLVDDFIIAQSDGMMGG